jgi:hypothetical protein
VTDEFLEGRVSVGIEDLYCAINVPANLHPVLPWLTETDMDCAW